MKNIHVIPTDKPSDLLLCIKDYVEHLNTPAENSDKKGRYRIGFGKYANLKVYQPQYMYITSNEKFIRDEYVTDGIEVMLASPKLVDAQDLICRRDWKKIVLTTDQSLDGVQEIDDEFLKWFVKNPSCEEIEVISLRKSSGCYDEKEIWHWDFLAYKIIIPKEEPKPFKDMLTMTEASLVEFKKNPIPMKKEIKQETIEEAAHKILDDYGIKSMGQSIGVLEVKKLMVKMAKWQQERSYSEEELLVILHKRDMYKWEEHLEVLSLNEWFETIEEVAEKRYPFEDGLQVMDINISEMLQLAFINGAKWQQERSYSEEEVYGKLHQLMVDIKLDSLMINDDMDLKKWFNQNKKK